MILLNTAKRPHQHWICTCPRWPLLVGSRASPLQKQSLSWCSFNPTDCMLHPDCDASVRTMPLSVPPLQALSDHQNTGSCCAHLIEATTAAPEEMPHSRPSSLARRRAMSTLSLLLTLKISSIMLGSSTLGTNPAPIPCICSKLSAEKILNWLDCIQWKQHANAQTSVFTALLARQHCSLQLISWADKLIKAIQEAKRATV